MQAHVIVCCVANQGAFLLLQFEVAVLLCVGELVGFIWQAEAWKAIAHIPWMIKPIYGFVTDTFPIYGLRRQPYLVICGLTGDIITHNQNMSQM